MGKSTDEDCVLEAIARQRAEVTALTAERDALRARVAELEAERDAAKVLLVTVAHESAQAGATAERAAVVVEGRREIARRWRGEALAALDGFLKRVERGEHVAVEPQRGEG